MAKADALLLFADGMNTNRSKMIAAVWRRARIIMRIAMIRIMICFVFGFFAGGSSSCTAVSVNAIIKVDTEQ